jgi:DNA-binding NarL/FixJ family response regulator
VNKGYIEDIKLPVTILLFGQEIKTEVSAKVTIPPRTLLTGVQFPRDFTFTDNPKLRKPLTNRQRQILERISRGMCNKEIAADINIAERTVKFHLTVMFEKYGIENRGQLARLHALGSFRVKG